MIVSPSRKFAFVHIPKTGGTTIEGLLVPFLEPGRDAHISRAATLPQPGQPSLTQIKGGKHALSHHLRTHLGASDYDNYFSFAFSRNPYARCYSAYRFLIARSEMDTRRSEKGLEPRKQRRADKGADPALVPQLGFEDICRDLPGFSRKYALFMPQTRWLRTPNSVDFVGRLENMAEDLGLVFDRLGLPKDSLASITPANQKTAPSEWRSMSPDCAARIRGFYAADFERFGYGTEFDTADIAPARTLRDRRARRSEDGVLSRVLGRIRSVVAT